MSDYERGFQQGVLDRQGGVPLDSPEALAEWDAVNQDWKGGWSDGYEHG